MKIGIIDLGTNTFNLLIAEKTGQTTFRILHSSKIAVKLAKGGFDKKELKTDAITRGVNAIEKFIQTAGQYHTDRISAYATAAIRNAKNAGQFIKAIQDKFGIEVTIIEGDREAELIYFGVRNAVDIRSRVLIVDIGGGSCEFVIADRDQIYWKKSYQMGVAYLLDKFRPSDPLSIEEIEIITNFFEEKLVEALVETKRHNVETMIGASGAFESFAAMIRGDAKFESETGTEPEAYNINLMEFEDLSWRLVSSTLKERKKMKGLETMRIEFIVLAALLVKFLLEKTRIQTLIQSNFSLKEGLMQELMESGEQNAP
jgi:exopolyphosphatase/guanosine-5'-triphosphate,3'-diphosphate pyrophosphatase